MGGRILSRKKITKVRKTIVQPLALEDVDAGARPRHDENRPCYSFNHRVSAMAQPSNRKNQPPIGMEVKALVDWIGQS